jgi:hypothetical protein
MSGAMRIAVLVVLGLVGCRALDPPNKPETACVEACRERARYACTEGECRTGCRMALDRMIEHEGERVISCVASATKKRNCNQYLWAECAAKIGPHADGGPPVPPPLPSIEDE